MENLRNHRDIKLITTKTRRNYLVSEPSHNTTKILADDLLPIEVKNPQNIHE